MFSTYMSIHCLYRFGGRLGCGYSYSADPNSTNAGVGNLPPRGVFLRSMYMKVMQCTYSASPKSKGLARIETHVHAEA